MKLDAEIIVIILNTFTMLNKNLLTYLIAFLRFLEK